jgi:uncharacterized protein
VRWRHLFRVIHRDIGYVCVALILTYALSGIAVNHADDWNPSIRTAHRPVDIGALPAGTREQRTNIVIERLDLDPATVRGSVLDSETTLRLILPDGAEVSVDTTTGRGTQTRFEKRAVFFEVNELHLNNLKGAWTYIADLFAVALIVLALTGMVMMKGDRGLTGRGKYFVGAGLLVPIGAVVYIYW